MKLSKDLARKFNLYTVGAVYVLILIGGIVRSMGAGMGCPDWPKCFGAYVPPASEAELPENYEELYVQTRVRKNQRLAGVLSGLGFTDLAMKVSSDPEITKTTFFDPQKAWIEYANRLTGVVIGFLIILNMVFSFAYKKDRRLIPVLGVAGFILVVFQGWVGSLVVSTNLLPGFITFHMALALLQVALLLIQQFFMRNEHHETWGKNWITALLVLFTLQIVFGTQIREQIDAVHSMGVERTDWVENLGVLYYIHRSYSLILTGLIVFVFYRNYKTGKSSLLINALVAIVVLEILLGVVLGYFSMPAFAQPAHLFLGTVAFGVIFYLFLSTSFKRSIA